MSYEKDQDEFSLPADGKKDQSSANFLPKFFRTEVNKKFLSTTLDQMISPGTIEKINAFAGRKTAKSSTALDNYLIDFTNDRQNYQFEPVTIYKDNLGNVEFVKDYNDYISQIKNFKGSIDNHSILNQQEFYSWDPHIDWDKFTNYREYYWLPFGPRSIPVTGQSRDIVSTYTVTIAEDLGSFSYVFSPDGLTKNPQLKLYRGQTYRFVIDTPGHPMAIAISRQFLDNDPTLGTEITNESTLYNEGVSKETDYIENGIIEFTVPETAPDVLFYISKNDINVSGQLAIFNVEENSQIDVELEILGKKTYRTSNNVELSNGMKIFFQGEVTPKKYSTGNWYVEGVGTAIRLVAESDLEIPAIFTSEVGVPFDATGWDTLPFEEALSFPGTPDYVVINRASADRNPWSRYNRWFHKDIVEISNIINGQDLVLDQSARATRPIIEFEAGLKLYKHGSKAKSNITLVDDFTIDVFSTVEGSIGYNIDGIDLTDGMRVLFIADPDSFVNGKIYEVKFIVHNGVRQISLIETADSVPSENETVLVLNGNNYKGKMFYYDGAKWNLAQDKTEINQPPLFELFDDEGNSYSDNVIYQNNLFNGNKVFGYKRGQGPNDTVLNFPLTYRNIANIGDIVFEFNLLNESYSYQAPDRTINQLSSDVGYLKKYDYLGNSFSFSNAWKKANKESEQAVIRLFSSNETNEFDVDVFDNSASLEDLRVVVFVNGFRQIPTVDYIVDRSDRYAKVIFNKLIEENSNVYLKCYSKSDKNENGYYEIPSNLEKNPLNENIVEFTLGQVNDHVDSIVENVPGFIGQFPGTNNLRDLGSVTAYGRKFVQHSGPMNLPIYHLTAKEGNIVKSIKFARKEYAKFKRNFLLEAENSDFSGSVKDHVDLIMQKINKDKVQDQPFYFSDMIGFSAFTKNTIEVTDAGQSFFNLSSEFNLNKLSTRSVNIYVNGEQLLHKKDYIFTGSFISVLRELVAGDIVEIYEYESTNASYIPPTPSKLGLYPLFEPKIYLDTTLIEPKTMIQGHDGSLILAFNDYRDDLILELEKRIFNNIKVSYEESLVDIYDLIGGKFRTTSISKEKIDAVLLADFANWIESAGSPDFTDFSFWDKDNPFTYNYNSMSDVDDNPLKGYWRNIFKFYYDTDRPHLAPWEMLGITIQPDWWESVYGPAPYTSNNTILWKDLSEGIVREPNKSIVRKEKFIRPDLLKYIPVDEHGRIKHPLDTGIAQQFVLTKSREPFVFGDYAPTETAWRRSSEYPFALITAWSILQPAKIFGLGFDVSRTKRDISGNIVYTGSMKRLATKDIIFPCVCVVENLKLSSGLLSYVANYLANYKITLSVSVKYQNYQRDLKGIDNQLAIKLGGFADKDKLKLVLDSRSPLNKGNVFVPDENYQIFLNSSSAIDIAVLSGIIIEKNANGFIISGYDKENPSFNYFTPINRANDPAITIGGISESFVQWESNREYPIGIIVEYQSKYYRSKLSHRSGNDFEIDKFIRLADLPIVGGTSAVLRREFDTRLSILPYGSILRSVQDVVDFMLGYEEYLKQQGFKFDYFNRETSVVENMQLCVKEFMFWTTQNWDVGTILTVSPAANKVVFERPYFVVGDVYDDFYDYNLLAGDGSRIAREFSNVFRDNSNQFGIRPVGTAEGIFLVKLPLVQKEHVVLIDNITVFNDVIFDKIPGYRQDRIKIVGYRTDNWNGGFNIPGFFYDEAKVKNWSVWTDYAVGDLVKYKEFFYTANKKHTSSDFFDANDWNVLEDRPEPTLYPNWDYKVNQFSDFYDLDSDNFDVEQQRLAQHLIGYQKRQYLANIINDDVSQYKFYQGFIQDKGTKNSLIKLFDALSNSDRDSLEFFEEWAIRLGQYGAVSNIEEIEYILDERKFRQEPQPIDLVQTTTPGRLDLIYEIPKFETFLSPEGYNHRPFVELESTEIYSRDSGYVRNTDVDLIVNSLDDLLEIDINNVTTGDYIWVQAENNLWNVYRTSRTIYNFVRFEFYEKGFAAILNQNSDFVKDEIIGFYSANEQLNGFFKVEKVITNKVFFVTDRTVDDFNNFDDSTVISVIRLVKRRFTDTNEINNSFFDIKDTRNEKIWIDDSGNGKWAVYENKNVFETNREIVNPISNNNTGYSQSFAVNDFNTSMVVVSPGDTDAAFRIYNRSSERTNWSLSQIVATDDAVNLGFSCAMSPSGNFIAVSDILDDEGKVYIYKKDNRSIFELNEVISSPVADSSVQEFGYILDLKESNGIVNLFVSAPLYQKGRIYHYTYTNESWNLVYEIEDTESNGRFGDIIDISSTANIMVVSSDADLVDQSTSIANPSIPQKTVKLFRLTETGWEIDSRFNYTSSVEDFGASVAINDEGTVIAIGAPRNDDQGTDNGVVYIYKQVNSEFVLIQKLFSPFAEFNEMFGTSIDFSGDKLVIASQNGDLLFRTSFDDGNTSFDKNNTRFVSVSNDVGKVYVYQLINNFYVYAEDLQKTSISNDFEINKFRAKSINNLIINKNQIYIGLPESITRENRIGFIATYRAPINESSWKLISEQLSRVDISKIKRCFLYNKRSNQILTDIDFIDPRTGKIPGPADQEISFKTFYDPAIYTNSTEEGTTVDPTSAWTVENVGRLWWNLNSSSWMNPYQGSIQYRTAMWNELVQNSNVEICEWVESDIVPSEWATIADTNEGTVRGISGQPFYDTDVYSTRRIFDPLTGVTSVKYYFWVVNKKILPRVFFRNRSAFEVAQLISDPAGQGYRFLAPLSTNQFALYNIKSLLADADTVLHITIIKDIENENNIHNEYQLITEGLSLSQLNPAVEQKWFDSLIGYDTNRKPVPDLTLPIKERYGILNNPRQGMFINRAEAVKQFVERANSILIREQITDNYSLDNLLIEDAPPLLNEGKYDDIVDNRSQLRFVSVARVEPAELLPIFVNGKLQEVRIINPGRGYKVVPEYKIISLSGSGAEIELSIDNIGKITSAVVKRTGKNYSVNDKISIRKFSVLIRSDDQSFDRWSIVEWNKISQAWDTVLNQKFDTKRYWNYVDWYDPSFTAQSNINFTISQLYQLYELNDLIGNVIKVENVGTGGWVLLQKINNIDTENYNLNYQIVGRENGTIQLSNELYNYAFTTGGFDTSAFDTNLYDSEPVIEFFNILTALKNDIFVGNLAVEWNNLFFASVRYVLSEQLFVDWIFKTSFVRVTHNIGELRQKITFQNDNLESYEDYVNETKPYSTKIREYISTYSSNENSKSLTTDFDLPPSYSSVTRKIEVSEAIFENGQVLNIRPRYNEDPFKNWIDNLGFTIESIDVVDGGSNYTETPRVIIDGVEAQAYLRRGSVSKIEIVKQDKFYLLPPDVIIDGQADTPARAIVKLGGSPIRTNTIGIKFDRISTEGLFDNLEEIEEFISSGARQDFILKWPLSVNFTEYKIYIDGLLQLSSDVVVDNIKDLSKGYTRYLGVIKFFEDPPEGSVVRIEYKKDINLLSAVDRINFFYNPKVGMPGKDLSQLMDGIEYSGVNINSFGFGTAQGWDVSGWGDTPWDTFNLDNEGNFILPEDSYDTALSGGSFAITSATGIPSGEIVVDGDGFVTVTTSKGPEELVPGQIADTLDIRVYHRPTDGVGVIGSVNYLLDGITTTFDLPGLPYSNDAAIVKISNQLIGSDRYTIDYAAKTITLLNDFNRSGEFLSILTLGTNGTGILDRGVTVYNNSAIDTNALFESEMSAFVSSNGIILNGNQFALSNNNGRVQLTVDNTFVNTGDVIQYVIYNSLLQNYSQISIDKTFVSDGINDYHKFNEIDNPIPSEGEPLAYNILVKVSDRILSPGYRIKHVSTGSLSFDIESWQFTDMTAIKDYEIFVMVNGTVVDSLDYNYDSFNSRILFVRNLPVAGDTVEIFITHNAEYFMEDSVITFADSIESLVSEGDVISLRDSNNVDYILTVKSVNDNQIVVEERQIEIFDSQIINDLFVLNGLTTVQILKVSYKFGSGITFKETPQLGELVEIYQFSNHAINNFNRMSVRYLLETVANPNTNDEQTRLLLSSGIIKLDTPVVSANYLWIIKNGILLSSNLDFILEDNMTIKLTAIPLPGDRIEVMQYALPPSVQPFGYRIFKDIFNRTHYKRLNQNKAVTLTQPLQYYDIRISLSSTANLSKPNKKKNIPGVLFIDGERIEYFEIKGNTVQQLRRGTLGTSIKTVYPVGEIALCQGVEESVPYRDQILVKEKIITKDDPVLDLGVILGVDEIEVLLGGRRLRKNEILKFNAALNQDSPEADESSPAEFVLNGSIIEIPEYLIAEGTEVNLKVIRKALRYWNDQGTALAYSENLIAKFLREATIELPK